MKILGILSVLVFVMFYNSFPALSQEKPARETVEEALDRLDKQAEKDRKQIPIYAITEEALSDQDNDFPNMPPALIAAARDHRQNVLVGMSDVDIQYHGEVVTFTVTSRVNSSTSAYESVHSWRSDPLEYAFGWMNYGFGAGFVYAKGKDGPLVAVPSFATCSYLPFSENESEEDRLNRGRLRTVCERFGFHKVLPQAWKTENDYESENDFLAKLVQKYGKGGILTRARLARVYQKHHDELRQMIEESSPNGGYIKYHPFDEGPLYQLQEGVRSSAIVLRDYRELGYMDVLVEVYDLNDAEAVVVELEQIEPSIQPLFPTEEAGNLSKASFNACQLSSLDDNRPVSWSHSIEIPVPTGLPENVPFSIVVRTVGKSGNTLSTEAFQIWPKQRE